MPLTIEEVECHRATSKPLTVTVTSYKQFDAFKSAHSRSKPKSKPLAHRFSTESRLFSGAALKKLGATVTKLSAIPLGTGRPTARFFPWESISISSQCSSSGPSITQTANKSNEGYDLAAMLDYGHAAGAPELHRFVTEHVELLHDPPYQDWGTCLSSGSTSAMEIALRIFCNRGDIVLAEEHTYPGFIEVAGLVGVQIRGLEMDAEGPNPKALERLLRNWDESQSGPKPSVLYTIPSGQNPTGVTQTAERKRALYQVSQVHDLMILEDDPYYFLHLESRSSFCESLPPSYLSLDIDGRVVRMDSASKILAPGLRAGWVAASDAVIDKFLSYHEVCTASVSGPTQMMLLKLLDESWGHRGFLVWLENLAGRYRARRDVTLEACQQHLPDVCQWNAPSHGMFLWIKLDLDRHPDYDPAAASSQISELASEVEERILAAAMSHGVQVTRGALFDVNRTPKGTVAFRLTFAATFDESELKTGVELFARAVRDEFQCS